MRIALLLVVGACAADPVDAAQHAAQAYIDIIPFADPPPFDLGSLSAAGPPAGPQLGGGGLGSPSVQGGLGTPSSGGLGPPSGAGGGISSGPAGVAPDRTVVALACELFDVIFQRVARCEGDPGGVIGEIDQLFHGETCEAYVEGVLRVSPQPVSPQAVAAIRCFTQAIRDAPCNATPDGTALLQRCGL